MIIDFRLKVFETVATKLNFTKAASELFISQPAVTKHIAELEKQVGHPLFNRIGNTISLTIAGEVMLSYIKRINNIYTEMNDELSMLNNDLSGKLNIGASTTIAQYVLPSVLPSFINAYPEVEINFVSGNTEFIEHLLLENKIDFGIIEGNASSHGIHYEPFIKDEIVLVTANGSKFKKEEITVKELIDLPLVLRENGSGTLEVIDKSLEQHKIKRKDLNVEIRLDSTEGIKQYILNSDSFAFLSLHTISNELTSGKFRIVEIKDCQIYRMFHFISLHGRHLKSASVFQQFCQRRYN